MEKIIYCSCGVFKHVSLKSRSSFVCEKCRLKNHICQTCGNEFKSVKSTSKFCSKSCRTAVVHELNKGRIKSDETKNKISKSIANTYKNGKPTYGGYTKWYKYKDIKVQGTFELRVCKILDKWISENKIFKWEYTNDRIDYTGMDGKLHSYLIDFKVYENEKDWYYLEVKGFEKPSDKLKWEAVRKNFRLNVWFQEDIEKVE